VPSSATDGAPGGPARSAPATIGLDLGGTKVLGVVLDSSDRVVAERRQATPEGGPALLDALAAVVTDLGGDLGPKIEVRGVGVGAPGLVDRSGVLHFAANLRGGAGLDVAGGLSQRLGSVPVVAENDATAAVAGESRLGAAAGRQDVVLVTLGTGIGTGVVSGDRPLLGANGFAGEFGHMVVEADGLACPCGKRGCWERYASGSGLGRLGREAAEGGRAPGLVDLAGGDPEAVRGEHVVAAASSGDEGALAVMEAFGRWLALGLAGVANALDPEMIVLGGGLVSAGDLLFEPTRRAFGDLVYGAGHRPVVPIVPAALGEAAGAVGAAVIARGAPG
jgi:glucokinase